MGFCTLGVWHQPQFIEQHLEPIASPRVG
jgi:hypothetical protein